MIKTRKNSRELLKANIVIIAVILTAIIMSVSDSWSQTERRQAKHRLFSDTLNIKGEKLERSNEFYDTLKEKEYKSWIIRGFYRLLIASRNTSDAAIPNTELELSRHYFNDFTGKVITQIRIVQANVFDAQNAVDSKWIDRFINSLHPITHEKELRQNLLFRTGDTIQPYRMAINEQLLRDLPYLSTAFIVVTPDGDDPQGVIVNVFARDNWTISANASLGGSTWLEVYDRNIIGSGNELKLKYYLKQGDEGHGFEANYNIDNLWGTFAKVDLSAGVGSTNNRLNIVANRPFILPNDHIYGFRAGYEQKRQGIGSLDTTMLVNVADFGLWYGYSFVLDKNQGTNFYIISSINSRTFKKRPYVDPKFNPAYHNQTSALISFGVARQNYFQGNMIYGYGRTEDIPFGFRFDVTSGLQWSEFNSRRYYVGASAAWGDMTPVGYFNSKLLAGTFIGDGWEKSQGQISYLADYFSPLYKMGRYFLRQFISVSATWGLNRYDGEQERLSFNQQSTVRGMRVDYADLGYNRFTAGAESVLFTPIFFYHFRFAFTLWGDVGWLGRHSQMFKNPLASSIGIGINIKNERLIFNSISMRLGFAVVKPDNVRFNPFQISVSQPYRVGGFAPTAPVIMPYE